MKSLEQELTERVQIVERANAVLMGKLQASENNLEQARIANADLERRLREMAAERDCLQKLNDLAAALIGFHTKIHP